MPQSSFISVSVEHSGIGGSEGCEDVSCFPPKLTSKLEIHLVITLVVLSLSDRLTMLSLLGVLKVLSRLGDSVLHRFWLGEPESAILKWGESVSTVMTSVTSVTSVSVSAWCPTDVRLAFMCDLGVEQLLGSGRAEESRTGGGETWESQRRLFAAWMYSWEYMLYVSAQSSTCNFQSKTANTENN